ncbi:glycoside hydrolase family 28 protein [Paracoccaceae bacterium GXU_MW_L88]
MTVTLELVSLSARTATLLCRDGDTRYHLGGPRDWRLTLAGGEPVQSGQSDVAPVFLEALSPETDYVFAMGGADLRFRTAACAGAVNVADFGADPEAADNSAAFAEAIAAVPQGGTLMVPPGRYRIRPIFLKADMTLYLPEGATLYADHDRAGWPILPPHDDAGRVIGTWEGLPEAAFAAPVTALDCNNLIITGRGTLDAGGDRGDWWDWPKETRDGARRPRALFVAHGKNVQLSGITVQNSPSWTVHPYRIDRLTCAALRIENPPDSPNTDGLNPESCTHVDLVGIHFSVGDDCIAVKAGKRTPAKVEHIAPTRLLKVRHCMMARGHGAVVLGSEMSGDITDVHAYACEFTGTDRGLRIKTRRGRGGKVAHVRFENVLMRDVATPLAINAFYYCDPDGRSSAVQSRGPRAVDASTPEIYDICFENVTATGVQAVGAAILGLPEMPVKAVALRGFQVSFAPDAAPQIPLMADDVPALSNTPIWSDFAEVTGTVEVLSNEKEPQ